MQKYLWFASVMYKDNNLVKEFVTFRFKVCWQQKHFYFLGPPAPTFPKEPELLQSCTIWTTQELRKLL